VLLYEDVQGEIPDEYCAPDYADDIGADAMPVLSDLDGVLIDSTPWNGSGMPAWCVVSPRMELLDCFGGVDPDRLVSAITTHHASN
jgi:hypothetical protein